MCNIVAEVFARCQSSVIVLPRLLSTFKINGLLVKDRLQPIEKGHCMPESPNRRRLRELEEIARQVKAVLQDLNKEIRELRRELGLPEGDNACPQP
jgi:hypothetical protein